jgi:hypothetical protein
MPACVLSSFKDHTFTFVCFGTQILSSVFHIYWFTLLFNLNCSLVRWPGTPGIFSMLETLKRHKRQTATQREKVRYCIKTVTNRLDIWFNNVAVGILLMLIALLENDLIAKNGSYLAKIICLVLSTLSHSCLACLFCVYWDKLDMTRHD